MQQYVTFILLSCKIFHTALNNINISRCSFNVPDIILTLILPRSRTGTVWFYAVG